MARQFAAASLQFLENENGFVVPLTMACWAWANDVTGLYSAMAVSETAGASHRHQMQLAGTVIGDPIRVGTGDAAGSDFAVSTGGYTANTWFHACGVWASTTDRRAFINGGSKGTNAGSRSPTGLVRTSLGRLGWSTPTHYLDGRLAEAAIWDVALTDDEVAQLGDAFCPLLVRPGSLVAYWPIIGRFSPEIDVVGAFNMTVTGATVQDHPKIIYPSRRRSIHIAAAAAAALKRNSSLDGLGASGPFFHDPLAA